jgi:hypothetical protein
MRVKMAEAAPVVHIGENSPEQIAYKLLLIIASKEGKLLEGSYSDHATADRKWLLDTYAECLTMVQNPSSRANSGSAGRSLSA